MFGGGGGLNPRKMQQMMEQMGIDVDEIDAEEVIIRTGDEDLVFENPDVTRMDARGQQTYQVVGEPSARESSATGAETDAADDSDAGATFDEDDVELVVQQTGASEAAAREALEETGDLAAAVARLE